MSTHPLLAALQALAREDLHAAKSYLRRVSEADACDPNYALARALVARREGQLEDAIRELQVLEATHPGVASITYQLGVTLEAASRPVEALARYASASALRHAMGTRRLAELIEAQSPIAAGPIYLEANRLDPRDVDALYRSICCATTRGRSPAVADEASKADGHTVSVVVCSRTNALVERLSENLRDLLPGIEIVVAWNPVSLCAGYEEGLSRVNRPYTILCHDDVRSLSPRFGSRLLAYLSSYDLIGVAGSTEVAGPAVFWAGAPHVHGWITHSEGGRLHASVASGRGPVVEGAKLLDGLFMAGRTSIMRSLGFDTATFDGFHLYDLDFSLRASRAGHRVAICQDLLIEHLSRGKFDAAWAQYAERFVAKFSMRNVQARYSLAAEVAHATEQSVVSMYEIFAGWVRAREAWQGGAAVNVG